MSLDNLLKTGQLKRHEPNAVETQRLLAAARRNVADAQSEAISAETRFDVCYKSIMQCAMVGLMASGFRPSSNLPGHHQTMIQTLPLTLGTDRDTWLVLDALRKKRNANDYLGELIDPESLRECIRQSESLLALTEAWLAANHPALAR